MLLKITKFFTERGREACLLLCGKRFGLYDHAPLPDLLYLSDEAGCVKSVSDLARAPLSCKFDLAQCAAVEIYPQTESPDRNGNNGCCDQQSRNQKPNLGIFYYAKHWPFPSDCFEAGEM